MSMKIKKISAVLTGLNNINPAGCDEQGKPYYSLSDCLTEWGTTTEEFDALLTKTLAEAKKHTLANFERKIRYLEPSKR